MKPNDPVRRTEDSEAREPTAETGAEYIPELPAWWPTGAGAHEVQPLPEPGQLGAETAAPPADRAAAQAPPFLDPVSSAPVLPVFDGGAAPETHRLALDIDVVGLADLLVGLLEYRDPFYRGGASFTRLLTGAIARAMGLDESRIALLELAAVLRDLGRTLQGQVSARPTLDLDDVVRRRIERHVTVGLDLLGRIRLPAEVLAAIRHHHERWDGAGYPDGLSGERIPLGARILAVADSFSAMTAPRPYRPPQRIPTILEELRKDTGSRYDPAVIEALLGLMGRRNRLPFGVRQRILVVDPDDIGARVLAATLCTCGYLAEVAGDLATARNRLDQVPADAVVLAAGLPDEDMMSFIGEVRSEESWAELPVIAVDVEPASRRVDLLNAGADVCFGAEAGLPELRSALAMIVKRWGRVAEPVADGAAPKHSHALHGALRELPLSWVLQAVMYDGKTGAIHVVSENGQGIIHVEAGAPRHAQVGALAGEEALREMLRWQHGGFAMRPGVTTNQRTIHRSTMHVLLDHGEERSIFGSVKTD